jgi:hypothetical protein
LLGGWVSSRVAPPSMGDSGSGPSLSAIANQQLVRCNACTQFAHFPSTDCGHSPLG